ncbi:MAG: hypothetical protein ACHQ51_10105 [Elusimicrobiota bacterium]
MPKFLGAIALGCLAVSMYFLFKAGSVGDMKGGTWGDPALALVIEARGMLLLVVGAIMIGITWLFHSVAPLKRRIPLSLAVAFFSVLISWCLGFYLEEQGTCIAPIPAPDRAQQLGAEQWPRHYDRVATEMFKGSIKKNRVRKE